MPPCPSKLPLVYASVKWSGDKLRSKVCDYSKFKRLLLKTWNTIMGFQQSWGWHLAVLHSLWSRKTQTEFSVLWQSTKHVEMFFPVSNLAIKRQILIWKTINNQRAHNDVWTASESRYYIRPEGRENSQETITSELFDNMTTVCTAHKQTYSMFSFSVEVTSQIWSIGHADFLGISATIETKWSLQERQIATLQQHNYLLSVCNIKIWEGHREATKLTDSSKIKQRVVMCNLCSAQLTQW